jgi:hypothetical protein
MTEAGVVFEVQSTRQSPIWSGVPLETIQRFFAQFQGHKSDDFGIGLPGRPSIVAEALPEVRGSEKWSVTLVQGDGDLVLLGKTGRLIKHSIRNNLTFDGQEQLITAANRRILSSMSLVHALPRSLEIQPQSQADALATIEHPILLIAALEVKTGSIQDKGQRLAEVEVSRSKPLLAVAVAFPKMDPETAVEAARKAKKYTGNAVYWRIYSEQFDTDDVEESLVSSDA